MPKQSQREMKAPGAVIPAHARRMPESRTCVPPVDGGHGLPFEDWTPTFVGVTVETKDFQADPHEPSHTTDDEVLSPQRRRWKWHFPLLDESSYSVCTFGIDHSGQDVDPDRGKPSEVRFRGIFTEKEGSRWWIWR